MKLVADEQRMVVEVVLMKSRDCVSRFTGITDGAICRRRDVTQRHDDVIELSGGMTHNARRPSNNIELRNMR